MGDVVLVQGTFYAAGASVDEDGGAPVEVDDPACRDGVFVADTLTIYQARMHG